jgi:hypothetical protein
MIRFCTFIFILLNLISYSQVNDSLNDDDFIHRSTILSSIIPASGQIHNNSIKPKDIKNRLWWKVPLVYGALSTSGYFIFFNHNEYAFIRNERLNRLDLTYSHKLYDGIYYTDSQLKILQSQYQRWRDLSVISFLGIYILQIIDANVEANLFLFDSSDKLTFQLSPPTINTDFRSLNTPQLTLTYRFNK